MAERIVRQLVDDIDGSEIPEGGGNRIEFSVRGIDYQIDLSSANIAKFDKVLKPYITAAEKVRTPARGTGRKSGNTGSRKNPGSRASSTTTSGDTQTKEHLNAIRDWGRANGYEVSSRGRIKAEIIEAFNAAH